MSLLPDLAALEPCCLHFSWPGRHLSRVFIASPLFPTHFPDVRIVLRRHSASVLRKLRLWVVGVCICVKICCNSRRNSLFAPFQQHCSRYLISIFVFTPQILSHPAYYGSALLLTGLIASLLVCNFSWVPSTNRQFALFGWLCLR